MYIYIIEDACRCAIYIIDIYALRTPINKEKRERGGGPHGQKEPRRVGDDSEWSKVYPRASAVCGREERKRGRGEGRRGGEEKTPRGHRKDHTRAPPTDTLSLRLHNRRDLHARVPSSSRRAGREKRRRATQGRGKECVPSFPSPIPTQPSPLI